MASSTKQEDLLFGRDPNPPINSKLKEKFDADMRRRNRAARERRRSSPADAAAANKASTDYHRSRISRGSEDPFKVNSTAATAQPDSDRKWINR